MKVAVCGTHGIGKTTLVKQLDETYDIGERIDEVARIVARSMGYDSLSDIKYWAPHEREYFQWRVFVAQVAEETSYGARDGFVSDRSVFDNLAYAIYYGCSAKTIEGMREFSSLHVENYDLLFYLPIPDELVMADTKDGFRMTDFMSLQKVDSIVHELLGEAALEGANVIELGTKRADWYMEAIKYIKEFDSEMAGGL